MIPAPAFGATANQNFFHCACFDGCADSKKEESVEYAYELKMVNHAEGYKAEKVWACDLYDNIWVLGSKKNDDGTIVKKTFCLGSDYDMVGGGDSNGAKNWRSPKLPENIWMEEIQSWPRQNDDVPLVKGATSESRVN